MTAITPKGLIEMGFVEKAGGFTSNPFKSHAFVLADLRMDVYSDSNGRWHASPLLRSVGTMEHIEQLVDLCISIQSFQRAQVGVHTECLPVLPSLEEREALKAK